MPNKRGEKHINIRSLLMRTSNRDCHICRILTNSGTGEKGCVYDLAERWSIYFPDILLGNGKNKSASAVKLYLTP